MIDVVTKNQPEIIDLFDFGNIGLFEVNDEGTVLYFRTGNGQISSEKLMEAVGRNFFEDVAPFENMEELRRHFKQFIKSDFPKENFTFFCRKKGQDIPAKIMLVRITERFNDEFVKTTIIDIRKT